METPSKFVPNNTSWTQTTQHILLETLVSQQRSGEKSGTGFKKEAWRDCVLRLENQGVSRTPQQVKTIIASVSRTSNAFVTMELNGLI